MELKYLKKYQIDRQFAPLPSGFPPSQGPVELINLNNGPKCITGSLKNVCIHVGNEKGR